MHCSRWWASPAKTILMRQISLQANSVQALWHHPLPTRPTDMRMPRRQITCRPQSEPHHAKSKSQGRLSSSRPSDRRRLGNGFWARLQASHRSTPLPVGRGRALRRKTASPRQMPSASRRRLPPGCPICSPMVPACRQLPRSSHLQHLLQDQTRRSGRRFRRRRVSTRAFLRLRSRVAIATKSICGLSLNSRVWFVGESTPIPITSASCSHVRWAGR
jgi:hypothetical protein